MGSGLKKTAASIVGWAIAGAVINLAILFSVFFGASMSATAGLCFFRGSPSDTLGGVLIQGGGRMLPARFF